MISNFIMAIFFTSVISVIAYLFLDRMEDFLIKKKYIQESYILMHIFTIGIFLTIIICFAIILYLAFMPGFDYFGVPTFITDMIIYVLAFLWIIGIIWSIKKEGWVFFRKNKILKECFLADKKYQVLASQIKKQLGIKKEVLVLQGYGLWSAQIVTKKRKPIILIPVNEYSNEQLTHIFTHELLHYKNKDRYFRNVMAMVQYIYWFNPLLSRMCGQLKRIDELYCDYCVCLNGVKPNEYVKTLYYDAIRYQNQIELLRNTMLETSFTEDKEKLLERIQAIMEIKHNKKKNYKVLMAGLLACMVVSISTGTVVFAVTDEIHRQVEMNFNEGEKEELTEPVQYVEYEEVCEDTNSEETLTTERAASSSFISTTIKSKKEWYSGTFSAKSGQKIQVVVNGSPSSVKLKVGIKMPNGNKRYIEGSGSIVHTFTLNQKGSYQVLIGNLADKSVKVQGSYNTLD